MKMKVEDLIRSNWIPPFQWLPAEDRGPRFLEWLEDVESKFAIVEWPKAEEGGKKLKRNTLLAVAGPEIRDKLKTLTGTGEDYDTAVQKLKEDLLADESLIFLISQALDMTQREGERMDDFALRVRKAHRRIDWDTVKEKHDLTNLMPILSVARGTSSQLVRDYCLSHKGIPELEVVLLKGRSKESTIYKNREMTGNLDTAGREVAVKQEKTDIETAYAVRNRYGKYSKRYELDQTQRQYYSSQNKGKTEARSETSKLCNFCGYAWPHLGGQTKCPAYQKECRNCGRKNHFARCCKSAAEKRSKGSIKAVWRLLDDKDQPGYSESEESEVESIYTLNTSKQDRITIGVNDKSVNFIIDTGSTAMIMTIQQFIEYEKKCCVQLFQSNAKLVPYGSEQPLEIVGKFEAQLEYQGKTVRETIYVVNTPKHQSANSLLSRKVATELGIVTLNVRQIEEDKFAKELLMFENVKNLPQNLKSILVKYSAQFKGIGTLCDKSGNIKYVKLNIDNTVEPVTQKYRPPPVHLEEKLIKELDKWEDIKATNIGPIIEKLPEDEPTTWLSNLVVTPKKLKPGQEARDMEVRPNIDMRLPNKAILRTRCHIPTVIEIRDKLQKAKAAVFSKLDIHKGYLNLALHPESRGITAHHTPRGPRRSTRLNYGTTSAAEIFQKEIAEALEGIDGCFNISDDIMVFGSSQKEHDKYLGEVLQRCQERDLRLGLDKCQFNLSEISYYGFVFTKEGMKPDPNKVATLKQAEPPKNASELRSFLGMATYSAPFISHFAKKTDKLRELLKTNKYEWLDEHQRAFEEMKECLTSETTLAYFIPKRKTELVVDGAQEGLSVILAQEDPNLKSFRVVSYASRACTDAERRYAPIERECLAAIWGTEKYHHYLSGGSFKLVTDHEPLVPLLNNPQKKAPVRIERMRIKIMGYDYQAEYRPGKDNPADWGSRHPLKEEPLEEEELEHYVNLLTHSQINSAITIEEIKKHTAESEMMQKIIKMIQVGQRDIKNPAFEPFKFVFPELAVVDGLVLRGDRIVVPNTLQNKIVNIAHEGHLGITKTKNLLRSRVWFPKMDKITEEVIRNCMACQVTAPQTARLPLKMTELPKGPMAKVSSDFYGPLPTGEYILLVNCLYSRYPMVRIVYSTSAKAVIPKLEEIFSEFGYPEEEFKSDNGSPFNSSEFKDYCKNHGFQAKPITPEEPKANGTSENFMKNFAKTIQTAISEKKDWRKELNIFLRNYRATPHQTTGKSPAEVMFPNRNFQVKLPSMREVERYHSDQVLRDRDASKKAAMKEYADSKKYVKEHGMNIGDMVLVPLIGQMKNRSSQQ